MTISIGILINYHATHDCAFLKILLPKKRDIGLHHGEQLAYDGRDTAKMSRPEDSAQRFGEFARFNEGFEMARIDLLCIRREEDRNTAITAQSLIT